MMASLLGNFCSPHRSFLTIATDPKGELSGRFADLPDVKIVSLTDREKCGYNPLFWYRPEMSDEEMEPFLKTMAEALVSDSGGERNAYFWANARKILIGLMAWLIRKGKSFPSVMTAISTHDVTALIEQALDESDSKLVKKMLSSYSGKTGEDMESILTEVTTSIDIFAASSSIDWSLSESPRMVSPYDIACDHSIFLSIEQERISEYGAFIRLFYAQVFQYLIADRENHVNSTQMPIWFLLEEAPFYGAIPHLDSFLSTCRSKKNFCLSRVSVYFSTGRRLWKGSGQHAPRRLFGQGRPRSCQYRDRRAFLENVRTVRRRENRNASKGTFQAACFLQLHSRAEALHGPRGILHFEK